MIRSGNLVLVMTQRKCQQCENIQHVWFKSQEEFDNWDCPVCRKIDGILPEGDDDEHSTTKSD
jgi:lipopolysaccharide biosynthesis regulator YciM